MAFCIKRREFVGLLGGATVAWPLVALAQKPDRSRRIGVLMSLGENDPEGKAQLSGFTQGLADLGWSDGTNLRTDVRWGGGDVGKIRTFAKELVVMHPDVILAQGTPVTAALQRETRTIPIVFVVVTDPVGEGFVAGLPVPGGNITGFITSEAAMGSKMLDLLLDIAPAINRVAMIFNPDTAPGGGRYYLGDFETAARSSKVAKLVDEDFTWKDPKAAEKAGMPMMDYVIGGMDRSFKLKLFHMLLAAEEAELSPGITTAFRDDYRQSITSGVKAASDRSYHGGGFPRGYGHRLAAPVPRG